MRYFCYLTAAFFCMTVLATPNTFDINMVQKSGLTETQAKEVLLIVLMHEKYRLDIPGVFLEPLANEESDPFIPGYYSFALGYDSPQAGATDPIGSFSINRTTGDVWETNECKRYHFSDLKQLQNKIMQKTGKTMLDDKAAYQSVGCPY